MTESARPQLTAAPVAKAEMLIRKPVAEVFNAFVDPAITTKFWFTKSSGRLEPGAQVQWDWEMFGASAQVNVLAVEPNERIHIEWAGDDSSSTVEWRFTDRADGTTFVSVTHAGFTGTGDEIVAQVVDSTEGFTLSLIGLKALFEHGVNLNLVRDRFPDAVQEGK